MLGRQSFSLQPPRRTCFSFAFVFGDFVRPKVQASSDEGRRDYGSSRLDARLLTCECMSGVKRKALQFLPSFLCVVVLSSLWLSNRKRGQSLCGDRPSCGALVGTVARS